MADINFRFDVDAPPTTVLEALKTSEGIQGFWTATAEVPAEVGETLRLGFAMAPASFDLRLERSDETCVAWSTETFPPHWVGTTIRWDVRSRDGGATVAFRHAGFTDIGDAGSAAYTWGQIMVKLKRYAETGKPDPVFA
jgi:uncharacterized protein YndB with AHSA1/START domain